jgi:glycosyltransferase involved in cell wall biosynthesis
MKEGKIRVLMLGPDLKAHSGISAIVNNYYEAGLESKVDVKYIGTMNEGSRGKKLLIAAAAYFRFLCALGSCDIVHANASSDNSFMRKSLFIKAAKRRGKKVVLHQHGGDFVNYFENQISDSRRAYIRSILDMADAMLVLTPSWKEYFGKLTDPDKIMVLPNAIVTGGDAEQNFSGPHDLNKVLFLGRICRDKGISELLEAIDEIHKVHDDVRLYLGGIFEDPEYLAEVEERSTYVKHIGWVRGKDKNKYLSECGIMAVPSYFEGFGMTVIEAMYSGLVVVGSRVGGIPEIVDDGVDGILVEPRNSSELKTALEEIIEGKRNTSEMLNNGRRKVEESYSISHCMDRLVTVYSDLMKDNKTL